MSDFLHPHKYIDASLYWSHLIQINVEWEPKRVPMRMHGSEHTAEAVIRVYEHVRIYLKCNHTYQCRTHTAKLFAAVSSVAANIRYIQYCPNAVSTRSKCSHFISVCPQELSMSNSHYRIVYLVVRIRWTKTTFKQPSVARGRRNTIHTHTPTESDGPHTLTHSYKLTRAHQHTISSFHFISAKQSHNTWTNAWRNA